VLFVFHGVCEEPGSNSGPANWSRSRLSGLLILGTVSSAHGTSLMEQKAQWTKLSIGARGSLLTGAKQNGQRFLRQHDEAPAICGFLVATMLFTVPHRRCSD
jgi:hypothetical protein